MTSKEQEFFFSNGTADTEDVGMDHSDIVRAMHGDARFFLNFYMAEELEYPVPDFHVESWNLITSEMVQWIALALPRGHAKTTLAKLCCVWYLLFTDTRFIVYVSNTSTVAAEACKDIVAFLQSDNHRSVFGDLQFEMEREAHGYYKFWMHIPDGNGGFRKKYVILKALGAGQQVRGLNVDNERPQMAVVDDLEDNENTSTTLLQKKLKLWFFGAFMKALSKKRRKVIYLGNMLSNQSLLYYMCELSPTWHSIRKGCLLSNGLPLWPELWSFEAIRADFVEYQKAGMVALWFAEMMNMPMAEGQALIDPDLITYMPLVLPGQQSTAFITYDPAVSQKTWANESAIAVHGYVADRWQIVEVVHGKFTLDQVFYILVELCLKWQTRVVGVEAGAWQTGIKLIFELLAKTMAQQFEIYEIPHKNRAKVERLSAWTSALKKRLWTLTEGDMAITQQLIGFDPLKTNNVDDIIDACAMGIIMTELYMPVIMDQYKTVDQPVRVTKVLAN